MSLFSSNKCNPWATLQYWLILQALLSIVSNHLAWCSSALSRTFCTVTRENQISIVVLIITPCENWSCRSLRLKKNITTIRNHICCNILLLKLWGRVLFYFTKMAIQETNPSNEISGNSAACSSIIIVRRLSSPPSATYLSSSHRANTFVMSLLDGWCAGCGLTWHDWMIHT